MPLIPPLIDLLSNETRGRVFVSGGLGSNIPSSETRIGDVAGETLKRIGTCAVDHWGEYVEQAVDSALSPSAGKESVHALGETLSGGDLGMRLSAAKALTGLKDAEKIPHLVRALQSDTNDEVRRLAVWGLQGHRTPLVGEALIRAIRGDSSSVIRRSAAQQLGFFKDPQALEAVATAVREDKSTDVRIAALSSLYAMADHNGLKRRTLEHAAQNDVDQKVRNSATNLLNRL